MNLIDVSRQFATTEACVDSLEAIRWPEGIACVHCNSKAVSRYTKQEGTRQRFEPLEGTVEVDETYTGGKYDPALVIGPALSYRELIAIADEAPNAGPEVAAGREPF